MYKIFHGFHLVEAYKESQTVSKESDSGPMYKVNHSYYPLSYFMVPSH